MLLIASGLYRFDDFELQPSRRVLMRNGERVALAPKTFEVLLCLVQHSGRVVLKEELFKTVWPDAFIEDSNLTQHIFWLRKALADKSGYIVTIPGRGYEFTGRVETVPDEDSQPTALAHPTTSLGLEVTIHRAIERTTTVVEETSIAPHRVQRRTIVLAIAAGLLTVAALAVWGGWRWLHRTVPGDHHEVVLADFENATGESAFDPALKTLLAIDLNQSPYLVIAGDNDIQTALKLMIRKPGEPLTPPVALEVCQRLNDQVVLKGLIANFGHKYLVTLTATDCQTGKSLAANKATADGRDDVLKAVDSVAADMRRRLGESLKSHPNSAQPLQLAHTFSLDALRAYSQALALAQASKNREAIPLYQRAIDLDPKFAAAWLDLAHAYNILQEGKLSRDAVTRAYELRDQGDDFLRLRIMSSYHDIVTGDQQARLRVLTEWTELYPNQAAPWLDLAGVQGLLGHHELAVEPARRAVALAPNRADAYSTLGYHLIRAGQIEQAKATCREALRRNLENLDIHLCLYDIAKYQHDVAAQQEQIAWSKSYEDQDMQFYELLTEGKAHAAVALLLQHSERLSKDGFQERVDRRARLLLRREADYGMDTELKQQLATIDPAKYPLNVIFANAELGRVAAAEAGLKVLESITPDTKPISQDHFAQPRAAIALARHQPEEAIADLEISRPYDLSSFEAPLMRGRAYLAAKQPQLAEREFRNIVSHDYVTPGMPFIPLAHLGLARALEMQGNHAAARREYETLFTLWKDADPDLPPLLQARAEYAKIQ